MVEETKTFHLDGKHQQLLDINKEVKNFLAEFTITPHILDFEIPYKVAVVTQDDLDNPQEPIKFKDMQKSFSGTVKNLEGIPQNYYLAIKSEKPMKGLSFKNKLTEVLTAEPEIQQPLYPPSPPPSPSHSLPNLPTSNLNSNPNLNPNLNPNSNLNLNPNLPKNKIPSEQLNKKYIEPKTDTKTLKYILALTTIVIGCFLMYYLYKQNKVELVKPQFY